MTEHNAWLLAVPFLFPAFFFGIARQDVARRMADMSGYSAREKAFTVAASLAPYPFLIATIWTPFTTSMPFFYCGLVLYGIGLVMFYAAVRAFAAAVPDRTLSAGIYRLSRNPMYVGAALVFLGICLVTASVLLFSCLIIIMVLQHFMILAEERVCRQKYGAAYEKYFAGVPRYLRFPVV
ncbi:MAG TPA: methyltransferase [Geobacteraceae bacterium]